MIAFDKDQFHVALGKALRELRDERGGSIDAVVSDSRLGLNRTALSQIELGEQQPYVWQIFEIAETLGISVDELFKKTRTILAKDQNPDVNL